MSKRLTDNEFHTKESKERACYIQEPRLQAIYDKLFDLEDIEEELGIDLVTLFKALKNGIYLVETDVLTKKTKIVETKVDELHYWGEKNYRFWIDEYATDMNIIGYGENWALTKKELEK